MKKKRLKDEKFEREYPEVWSDFSLEVVDKALVTMFDNYRKSKIKFINSRLGY